MSSAKAKLPADLILLKNIGPTLAAALVKAGVTSRADLARIGPAQIYRRMQARSERKLPVCYYLYSLEGAIHDVHWDSIGNDEKRRLRREAERER